MIDIQAILDFLRLTQTDLASALNVKQSSISAGELGRIKLKYTQVTNHTARRSFATNFSLLGFSDRQIATMMGLSSTKMLDVYNRIDFATNAKIVAEKIDSLQLIK